jgi:tRNA A64-2'-O-ribosylphosphate transferase
MARLVPDLAETLINSSFNLTHLDKPLRPFWVTTRSAPHSLPSDCLPVVCVSASKQVADGMERRNNNYTYIQGAADDHESWSNVSVMGRGSRGGLSFLQGLTSDMFWANQQNLLQCSRELISEMIRGVVESHRAVPKRGQCQTIDAANGQILLSTFGVTGDQEDDLGLIQVQKPHHDQKTPIIQSESKRLTIITHEGKKDQLQFLYQILPAVDSFGRQWLNGSGRRLLVADMDANYDTSVGILMLLLARFFDEDGQECPIDQPCEGKTLFRPEILLPELRSVTKISLRRRLEWIQQSAPQANPSRTTMKRVNEYAISGLRQTHRQTRDTSLQGAQPTD